MDSVTNIACSSQLFENSMTSQSLLPFLDTSEVIESFDGTIRQRKMESKATETCWESAELEHLSLQKKEELVKSNPGSDEAEVENEDDDQDVTARCFHQASELGHKVMKAGWKVIHHSHLPDWLKDNEYLIMGHRPPLNSFVSCFYSIFRLHTETGNIWTHLIGTIAFITIAGFFLTRPSLEVQWQEKAVFATFFSGAILCLGFSTLFHTVYCHSERVGKLFNKLDYCGIALLTMGSFVPWLYYSFYCQFAPKVAYLTLISVLGTTCIIVSLWDKFATPRMRPVRAAMFVGLGLSGVIPAAHYVIQDGFWEAVYEASLGWLLLMALLYISGAVIYAVRFPERYFPGKFDYCFQSHQIFHVFVLAAAFIHYHGITEIANYRLTHGDCYSSRFTA